MAGELVMPVANPRMEPLDTAMKQRPRLLVDSIEPFTYRCSWCDRVFLLPEDRTPREGAEELFAAFKEHVETEHPDEDDSQPNTDSFKESI